MNRTGIILFLIAVLIASALLSGCTTANKGLAEETKKEVAETQENSKSTEDKKPGKEDILKDMMDVPMEDFEAVDLEGNKVKLSDYKGKIIFLNFWATWCPPCREEMPLMEKLYNEYKDQDVVILAVNPASVELGGGTDSNKAENQVKEFVKDNGYTFPILFDKEDKAWSIYQQRGIPANYVIDKQGIIRYGFSGAFQSKEQMDTLLENIRAIE